MKTTFANSYIQYGTMQGGHDWYETLSKTYNDLGYKTSRVDPCVQFKKEDGNYVIMDTYTFGASNDDNEIKRRKEEIRGIWEVKDVGETEYFFGMRVHPTPFDVIVGTKFLNMRFLGHVGVIGGN